MERRVRINSRNSLAVLTAVLGVLLLALLTLKLSNFNISADTISNLSAPSQVRIGTDLNLHWQNNSQNETGIRIYKNNVYLDTIDQGYSTYPLIGINLQDRPCFKVKVFNQTTESVFSNEYCPDPANPTRPVQPQVQRPTAPSSLRATATSASDIQLIWPAVSSNVTGYKFYQVSSSIPGAPNNGYIGAPVHTENVVIRTQTTIGGLQPSTRYCYQIASFNGSGESNRVPDGQTINCATTHSAAPTPTGVTLFENTAYQGADRTITASICDTRSGAIIFSNGNQVQTASSIRTDRTITLFTGINFTGSQYTLRPPGNQDLNTIYLNNGTITLNDNVRSIKYNTGDTCGVRSTRLEIKLISQRSNNILITYELEGETTNQIISFYMKQPSADWESIGNTNHLAVQGNSGMYSMPSRDDLPLGRYEFKATIGNINSNIIQEDLLPACTSNSTLRLVIDGGHINDDHFYAELNIQVDGVNKTISLNSKPSQLCWEVEDLKLSPSTNIRILPSDSIIDMMSVKEKDSPSFTVNQQDFILGNNQDHIVHLQYNNSLVRGVLLDKNGNEFTYLEDDPYVIRFMPGEGIDTDTCKAVSVRYLPGRSILGTFEARLPQNCNYKLFVDNIEVNGLMQLHEIRDINTPPGGQELNLNRIVTEFEPGALILQVNLIGWDNRPIKEYSVATQPYGGIVRTSTGAAKIILPKGIPFNLLSANIYIRNNPNYNSIQISNWGSLVQQRNGIYYVTLRARYNNANECPGRRVVQNTTFCFFQNTADLREDPTINVLAEEAVKLRRITGINSLVNKINILDSPRLPGEGGMFNNTADTRDFAIYLLSSQVADSEDATIIGILHHEAGHWLVGLALKDLNNPLSLVHKMKLRNLFNRYVRIYEPNQPFDKDNPHLYGSQVGYDIHPDVGENFADVFMLMNNLRHYCTIYKLATNINGSGVNYYRDKFNVIKEMAPGICRL